MYKRQPLAGVRIVELAGIGPGPFAGMVLADLGAEVIGIDRPGGAGPFDLAVLRRGRRSICVDLKSPEGREIVLDLVASADALIEPYRPGVMAVSYTHLDVYKRQVATRWPARS